MATPGRSRRIVLRVAATPDQRRAFGEALSLRLSTKEQRIAAADELGMTENAVWLYTRGEREPDRDVVFQLERYLGERPGALSRILGYLPLVARAALSVRDAVADDPTLDEQGRRAVLAVYDVVRKKG